jgi:hypothetical protein
MRDAGLMTAKRACAMFARTVRSTDAAGGSALLRAPPRFHAKETNMTLRRFIIEPDIPKVRTFEGEPLRAAAAHKTFCDYLDEAIIRKRAEMSGFPATTISEVHTVIDPTTERAG